MRLLELTAQMWMKIDPYYRRQKCRPMILASGNIRFMGIFAWGSSWRGRQMRVGLTTTAIFGDLSGYFFETYRDKASSIIWQHAYPMSASNWLQNEWPWAAIWRQNPFSANTLLSIDSGVTSNFGPPCKKIIRAPSSRRTQAYPEIFIGGAYEPRRRRHRVDIETLKASRTPKASREEGYGQGCSLPSRLGSLGERRKLPQRGVRGRAPAENWFYRAMHYSAKRGIAIACRPSIRLSVRL